MQLKYLEILADVTPLERRRRETETERANPKTGLVAGHGARLRRVGCRC